MVLKKGGLIGLLIILMIPLVLAIEPSPEVECCFYLNEGIGGERFADCHIEQDLNEDTCETILQEWDNLLSAEGDDYQEYVQCCLNVVREQEVPASCERFDLEYSTCDKLATEHMESLNLKGVGLVENPEVYVIILLAIAVIVWWAIRRHKRKK